MKKILIIGSGAMGAAFSIPLIENRHHVTLSEPHNIKLISKLNLKKLPSNTGLIIPANFLLSHTG